MYLAQAGPGARERLAAVVASAKGGDALAPVTVVPPSGYAGVSLRRALAGSDGLLNVRFMALSRLAEYLGAESMAQRGRRPLTPAMESAVVRAVAMDTVGRGVLGAVAHQPSLHASLRSSFRDLARLTPAELDALALAGPLQAETVRLFRQFRERTQLYYVGEEMAQAAAESVTQGRGAAALRDLGALVFHLLAPPSPGERALLTALDGAAACSVVAVPPPADDDGAVAWWRSLGWQEESTDIAPGEPEALLPEGIASAPDLREEVRHVVRGLLRAAEGGAPFYRMAVLYRHAEPYARQLHMELGLAGVPAAGPDPALLRESAAGRLLLGLLGVIEDDFGRARLMQWLAEAPVWVPSGRRSATAELQRWEALSRGTGVVRGLSQWRTRLAEHVAAMRQRDDDAERRGELSEARARAGSERQASAGRLLAFVEELAAAPPPVDGRRWSDFARWARTAYEGCRADPGTWPEGQQDANTRVLRAIDELGGLDAVEGATTLASFRQALEQALAVSVGRSGATGAGVFVASLSQAQGMEFDCVWVVGMTEGSFPSRGTEDPLAPDEVRRSLPEGALPLRRATAAEERRAYQAALSAGARRFLSYARVDPSARRAAHPSPWLLEAAGALVGRRIASRELNAVAAPWMTVVQSMEDALLHVGAGGASGGGAADGHEFDLVEASAWRRAGGRLESHPLASAGTPLERALAMERARASAELTAWDGYVGGAHAGRLAGALNHALSPTALETWAACPYRHFLDAVLRVSAWDTPEEVRSISPLDRGSLVHTILEDFIGAALQEGAPGPGEAWPAVWRQRLHAMAARRFREAEAAGKTGRRVLWEWVQEDITFDLDTFLQEDNRRRTDRWARPWQAERRFGFDGAPVTLELPGGGDVRFRGVIDRVDVALDGSRAYVTDYKTGGAGSYEGMTKAGGDPLMGGTRLQLPVYALAVRDALPDAEVEAEYWFVSARGGFSQVTVPLDAVEARFRATVEAMVAGIRGGVFPANPGPSGFGGPVNCSMCDFDKVCPTGRQALWARKQSSPRATPYLRLAAAAESSSPPEESSSTPAEA